MKNKKNVGVGRDRPAQVVQNIDDAINRFYDDRLNDSGFFKDFVIATFPRLQHRSRGPRTTYKYLSANMTATMNPSRKIDAVYAVNFKFPDVQVKQNTVDEDDDAENSLDKIGCSEHVNRRIKALGREAPWKGMKFSHYLALFPVRSEGAALHLENAILSSFSSEDRHTGEWHYGTLGVWKTLFRWHLACYGAWDKFKPPTGGKKATRNW